MTVTPSAPLDPQMVNLDVRLTLATAASDGEVLVVLVSALFAGADGQPSVVRRDADRRAERIPLDRPTQGSYVLDGVDTSELVEPECAADALARDLRELVCAFTARTESGPRGLMLAHGVRHHRRGLCFCGIFSLGDLFRE